MIVESALSSQNLLNVNDTVELFGEMQKSRAKSILYLQRLRNLYAMSVALIRILPFQISLKFMEFVSLVQTGLSYRLYPRFHSHKIPTMIFMSASVYHYLRDLVIGSYISEICAYGYNNEAGIAKKAQI